MKKKFVKNILKKFFNFRFREFLVARIVIFTTFQGYVCIFVSSGCVLIFLLYVTKNKQKFSEKNIEELFFFSLSKTKIIFFKAKTIFFFLRNKKIKEIIILNSLRIFEEEVYYALALTLTLKLAI